MEIQTPPAHDKDSPPAPLLILNAPSTGPVDVPSGVALESLTTRMGHPEYGALWVRGPAGSGRTTLIRRAIDEYVRSQARVLGFLRIQCYPGLRVEETLAIIADFLTQAEIPHFHSVLAQRTPLPSKIRILFRILEETPVWIWMDDFQHLCGSSGPSEHTSIQPLVTTLAKSDYARSRWIIVTEGPGPDGLEPEDIGASVWEMAPESILDGEELLKRWAEYRQQIVPDGPPVPAPEDMPQNWLRSPLIQKLVFSNWSELRESFTPMPPESEASLEGAFSSVRTRLDEATGKLFDLLCAYEKPMSRGTLRTLCGKLGLADEIERSLRALRLWGLLDIDDANSPADRTSDNRIHVHPTFREIREVQMRLREREDWTLLHRTVARHLLAVAPRTRSLWDLYASYCHLRRLGDAKDAYEVQKTFLESFLTTGFQNLAKKVLEECLDTVKSPYREVVAGNLAIIYKNEGDHDRAIAFYKDSLLAFAGRGDIGNTARVYHQIGNTFFLKGDNEKALSNYKCCLDLAEQIHDASISLMARVQIANIQFAREEFEAALQIYREALETAEASNNKLMATALRLQISQAHMNRREFSEAEATLKAAEEVAIAEEDLRHLMKARQLQGLVASARRDHIMAFERFESASEIARRLGDRTETANCQLHMGTLERRRHRYKEAILNFLNARDTVARMKSDPRAEEKRVRDECASVLTAITRRLAELAEEMGEESFLRSLDLLGRPDPR